MTTLFIIIAITLCISFLCSILESVLLSTTPTYIAVLIKEQKRSGLLLEHLKENINRPLSVILTLNTLANTMGSAAFTFQIQKLFGDEMITISVFVLTVIILYFSEITPKSIGAAKWRSLAPVAAYIFQALIIILYPFVIITEIFNKILASKTSDETPDITREEVLMSAELGVEEGSIKSKESLIIKNLLMLDKIYVYDIMTPRSVIFALADDYTVEEIFEKHKPIRFSRIPVFHDSLDNVIGMTYRFKIHESLSSDNHNQKIGEITTPIASIPERMTVQQALDFFIKDKEHMALAVDEYGIVTGLVTLEDAIETLLGVEIIDELDSVADMRKFALDQWNQRKQKMRRS